MNDTCATHRSRIPRRSFGRNKRRSDDIGRRERTRPGFYFVFCVWQSSVRGCRVSVMFVYFVIKMFKCSPVPASFFPYLSTALQLYWGVLQLQQRLLLLYLWETTDAWSLRQLQLACAFGVRLPSVFRVDWSDSWLSTYQMSGGRRLLSEIERSPHSHRVLSSDRLHRTK